MSRERYWTEKVHISEIRVGDTILHTDGQMRTVCRNNIKPSFLYKGVSLFGDTYHLGSSPLYVCFLGGKKTTNEREAER